MAASKNYRFRRIRPLGVGGETDTSWKMGMLHQEEEKSMKKAQERLGENISLGNRHYDNFDNLTGAIYSYI